MGSTGSDRLVDMLIYSTGELENQLISLTITKNGQTERILDDMQMYFNEFRARFLQQLMSIVLQFQDASSTGNEKIPCFLLPHSSHSPSLLLAARVYEDCTNNGPTPPTHCYH